MYALECLIDAQRYVQVAPLVVYTMWFGTSNCYLRSMKLLIGQKWEKPIRNSVL